MAQQPCLIKNAITDIPAIRKQHWSRQNFLRRYGQLQVKADSRSNLPFAQGESNNKMTLEEYLNRSKTYLKARLPNHEFVFDFFDAMKADYVGNKKMTKLLKLMRVARIVKLLRLLRLGKTLKVLMDDDSLVKQLLDYLGTVDAVPEAGPIQPVNPLLDGLREKRVLWRGQ